ncbi:MAG: histidine phosphatase family protein [Nocardioides sp.]
MLHLVRHGRPLVDLALPAHEWELDPAGFDDVWALRERLPKVATWYSSPEPKAMQTASLLTDGPVGVIDGLREHVRQSTVWHDDFAAVVRRAFAEPTTSVEPGWEPLDRCRERVVTAVRPVLAAHTGEDVVLVGHGTAWTLLVAEIAGAPPDLEAWSRLQMPDVLTVTSPRLR